jgi:type IV pilus modification protein PilV
MTRFHTQPARGFSLLEVLVAVIILSVGLLALASLQLTLMRSSTDSKAQSVALAIAKDKLEDLRSFHDMNAYVALTDSGPTTSAPGDGSVTFSTTTTITRYALASTGSFAAVTDTATEAALSAANYVLGKDFKWAKVDVSWTEASGSTQHVILHDIIDGLDPTSQSKVVNVNSTSKARTARVIIYNPAGEQGVIPIAIDPDDNTNTAATNPKPVINESGVETRFDVLTYAGLSGGLAQAQAKVETVAIACTCDTATKPTATTARGYRPTYWNGIRYVAPSLTTYVPTAGQSAANAGDESPYCEQCCRDHYDPGNLAAGKAKFDPWRNTHTHYRNNNGTFTAVGVGQTKYDEACRLIRVDGIFRVAADFNDEYFNLLATKNDGSTTAFAPSATAIANYQALVLGYLDAKITSNGTSSTYNNPVAASTVTTLESTNHINDPTSITINRQPLATADKKWLHSRGLYIDYLEPEAVAAITAAKASCVTSNCTTAEKSVAILSILPFTSINLSELTDWSPETGEGYIAVTDGSFTNSAADGDPTTIDPPIRGQTVTANSIPATAQTVDATASQYVSNTGLAYRFGGYGDLTNNPVDSDEVAKTDTQTFAIPAGVVNATSGLFDVYLATSPSTYVYGSPTPTVTATGATSVNFLTPGNQKYHRVAVSNINASPIVVTVAAYNWQSGSPAKYTGQVIQCRDTATNAITNYTLTNADPKVNRCSTFALVSGTTGVISGTNITTTNPGLKAASTNITFSSIANNATVNLVFTGPTYTYATCTITNGVRSITAGNCP